MKCSKWRVEILALSRSRNGAEQPSAALSAHLNRCGECANFERTQRAIDTAFDSLRADPDILWTDEVPPQLSRELALLAFATGAQDRRSAPKKRAQSAWVAAAVLLLLALLLIPRSGTRKGPVQPAQRTATQDAFVQIPYAAPLAPYEYEQVKRVTVPVATLLAYGLRVDAAGDDGAVIADVAFGQDGRPLAVRVLTTPISKNGRSRN